MQRPAKPCTPVQIRMAPPLEIKTSPCGIFLFLTRLCLDEFEAQVQSFVPNEERIQMTLLSPDLSGRKDEFPDGASILRSSGYEWHSHEVEQLGEECSPKL